jgi:hypothetical protein
MWVKWHLIIKKNTELLYKEQVKESYDMTNNNVKTVMEWNAKSKHICFSEKEKN